MDQKYCLRWNNHPFHLISALTTLLCDEKLCDVTLACDKGIVKAHQTILSACSPYFEQIFVENTEAYPIICMQEVNIKVMRALLDFMYKGEVVVGQHNLQNFLRAAKNLKVRGLTENSADRNSTDAYKRNSERIHDVRDAQTLSNASNNNTVSSNISSLHKGTLRDKKVRKHEQLEQHQQSALKTHSPNHHHSHDGSGAAAHTKHSFWKDHDYLPAEDHKISTDERHGEYESQASSHSTFKPSPKLGDKFKVSSPAPVHPLAGHPLNGIEQERPELSVRHSQSSDLMQLIPTSLSDDDMKKLLALGNMPALNESGDNDAQLSHPHHPDTIDGPSRDEGGIRFDIYFSVSSSSILPSSFVSSSDINDLTQHTQCQLLHKESAHNMFTPTMENGKNVTNRCPHKPQDCFYLSRPVSCSRIGGHRSDLRTKHAERLNAPKNSSPSNGSL